MVCSKMCEKFSFGNKSYIKDSKQCVQCDLFIVTESVVCACCGSGLIACDDSTAATPSNDCEEMITEKKSFRYTPRGKTISVKTKNV